MVIYRTILLTAVVSFRWAGFHPRTWRRVRSEGSHQSLPVANAPGRSSPAYYKSQRPLRKRQKWWRHSWWTVLLSGPSSRQLGCQQDTAHPHPLPEALTQTLPIHPLFTPPNSSPPCCLISHLFLLAKRAAPICQKNIFKCHSSVGSSLRASIYPGPAGTEQSRRSSKEPKFLPSPSSHVSR